MPLACARGPATAPEDPSGAVVVSCVVAILKALAKQPRDRYPSATELHDAWAAIG